MNERIENKSIYIYITTEYILYYIYIYIYAHKELTHLFTVSLLG